VETPTVRVRAVHTDCLDTTPQKLGRFIATLKDGSRHKDFEVESRSESQPDKSAV
jgi:hypothetical protein